MAICGPEDSVYSCGQKWRAALRQREAAAHRLLLQQYGDAYRWLRDELAATLQAIEQAEGEVSPGKLWQSQRLRALLQQMDSEMVRLAQVAGVEVARAQADAVNMASQATMEMLQTAGVGVDFAAFPHEAFAALVGFLADGTPLAEHLTATLPAEAAQALRQSLLAGLAAGWNPRRAARYAAQKATGLALSRAMTIARTEMLRAYREATRAEYERSEVVEGWIWSAAKDRRVCPACLALDCKEFPTSQPMEGHPNCRCTMLPKIAGIKYRKTCGRDWLATQPPEVQDEILGKAGGLAYRAGAVRLEDFVGHKHDRRWGGMHYSRSLQEILGEEAARWKRLYWWQKGEAEKWLPQAEKYRDALGEFLGLPSRWKGHLFWWSLGKNVAGMKAWECYIVFDENFWRAAPERQKHLVLLHEMLHSFSPGMNRWAYKTFRGWEEGVVERMTHLMYKHLWGRESGAPVAYRDYIAILEKIRAAFGMREEDFYIWLFKTELGERMDAVIEKSKALFGEEVKGEAWYNVLEQLEFHKLNE